MLPVESAGGAMRACFMIKEGRSTRMVLLMVAVAGMTMLVAAGPMSATMTRVSVMVELMGMMLATAMIMLALDDAVSSCTPSSPPPADRARTRTREEGHAYRI